ncbi:hypothetical protein [Dietzia sp. CH92]|uniref:hypothetical protein n=1 Tax=Dietzia sp. CH92 TaxID=3051823 RepID=UPI0028D1FC13|nr:hypothetical protein [Dietzia sp. CH92]
MQKIDCDHCGITVAAEKYSPEHTGVQWLDDARACPLLRADDTGMAADLRSSGTSSSNRCPSLYATIDRAVEDGTLPYSYRTEPVRGVLA